MKKLLIAAAILAVPALVVAGTGGAEFNTAVATVTGWMQGSLGRLLTLIMIVVGISIGVMRSTIMPVVPAVAAALVLNVGPGVLGAILTATI